MAIDGTLDRTEDAGSGQGWLWRHARGAGIVFSVAVWAALAAVLYLTV